VTHPRSLTRWSISVYLKVDKDIQILHLCSLFNSVVSELCIFCCPLVNTPQLNPQLNSAPRSVSCLQDNTSAQTPQKTLSSFVKNEYLLVHYLAMDALLLLRAYASGRCLLSRCLANIFFLSFSLGKCTEAYSVTFLKWMDYF
jgi:hypothetical protein